jgi:hypothetical protein
VEAEGRRSVAERRSSSAIKKRRSRGAGGEDELERKVIKLAIVVAIAIFGLIAFLIVRHFVTKRTPTDTMNPHQGRAIYNALPLHRDT